MPMIWWGFAGLSVLLLVFLVLTISLFKRMKHFEASYVTLQTFMSGQQLDVLFQKYIQKVVTQEQELKICNSRLDPIEEKLRVGIDRAELIRFRAFENTGSDLSFALALLNQEGSGVVLSSIHTRDESRVYAKPLDRGNSAYSLTEEEKEVISRAMRGNKL